MVLESDGSGSCHVAPGDTRRHVYADVATKTEWHDTATVLSVGAVAGVLELVILNRIFNYFRPVDELADVSDTSS